MNVLSKTVPKYTQLQGSDCLTKLTEYLHADKPVTMQTLGLHYPVDTGMM